MIAPALIAQGQAGQRPGVGQVVQAEGAGGIIRLIPADEGQHIAHGGQGQIIPPATAGRQGIDILFKGRPIQRLKARGGCRQGGHRQEQRQQDGDTYYSALQHGPSCIFAQGNMGVAGRQGGGMVKKVSLQSARFLDWRLMLVIHHQHVTRRKANYFTHD